MEKLFIKAWLAQDAVKRLVADRRGATAIEYGLIAAGIAVAIITVISTVGSNLNSMFGSIASAVNK